jgi:hypothetical protein
MESINDIVVKTPYAYAYALVLLSINRKLNQIKEISFNDPEIQKLSDIDNIVDEDIAIAAKAQEKYSFSINALVQLHEELNELFQFTLPNEESELLATESEELTKKFKQLEKALYINSNFKN